MDLYGLRFKLQDVEKEILKEKDNQEKILIEEFQKLFLEYAEGFSTGETSKKDIDRLVVDLVKEVKTIERTV